MFCVALYTFVWYKTELRPLSDDTNKWSNGRIKVAPLFPSISLFLMVSHCLRLRLFTLFVTQ
jgi:hypothetical protein